MSGVRLVCCKPACPLTAKVTPSLLLVLTLLLPVLSLQICTAQAVYPLPFHAHLYVATVDPDRKVVSASDSKNHLLILDLSHSRIKLPSFGQVPGETGDLVPGMLVQVDGFLVSENSVHASIVRVLPYVAPPVVSAPAAPAPVVPLLSQVHLQGTVLTVNSDSQELSLQVGDHVRTVVAASTLEVQTDRDEEISPYDLKVGDHVLVIGKFNDAEQVVAASITRVNPPAPAISNDNLLVGTVNSAASLFSRDIKVDAGDQVVRVKVPKDTLIQLDGAPASIHKIDKGMPVRIHGQPDGSDGFTADRIDASSQVPATGNP